MKKSKLFKKILLLVVAATIPRLVLLNTIPTGVNFDEIDYILNAKTVFYALTDISGRWNPFSLTTLPDQDPKGELPALLLAPFIGPQPFSLFSSRLPFSIMGILSVVLVYLIGRKLFGEDQGFLAGIVLAFNPLAIFVSRIGYDDPLAATFYLCALASLLYARRWFLLLAILPLFLGFYTYIGTKLILLPFTAVVVFYAWKIVNKRKYGTQYFLVVLASAIIVLQYALRLPSLPAGNRVETLFTPFHPDVIKEVDTQRRLSLETPIKGLRIISVNKAVIYLQHLTNRYLGAVSFPLLFFSGDTYHFFFLWHHGVFYYTDVVFLVLGFYVLVRKHKKARYLVAFLLPIFLLPSVLSGTVLSYVYRSYLFYIFLAMLIGLGLAEFIRRFKSKSSLVLPALLFVYALQFYNFAYEYFVRNPVYHQDQFQFTYRVFSRYILEEAKTGRKIVVLGVDPRQIFQQYILYSGLFDHLNDKDIRDKLADRFRQHEYQWDNITFTTDCALASFMQDKTVIMRDDYICETIDDELFDSYLAVARISDSGYEFRIYNGTTCDHFNLPGYIRSVSFADLRVENITLEHFCGTYIIRHKTKETAQLLQRSRSHPYEP